MLGVVPPPPLFAGAAQAAIEGTRPKDMPEGQRATVGKGQPSGRCPRQLAKSQREAREKLT